jgi:hypothetical protein
VRQRARAPKVVRTGKSPAPGRRREQGCFGSKAAEKWRDNCYIKSENGASARSFYSSTLQVDLMFRFRIPLPWNVTAVVLSTFDSEYHLTPEGEVAFPQPVDVALQKNVPQTMDLLGL